MAVETIPARTVKQIHERLHSVAGMLRSIRALVNISDAAATRAEAEEIVTAIPVIAERAHLIIDACLTKMGDGPLGDFRDDEWDNAIEPDEEGEGGAA
jgi:hypothetical protein